MTIAGRPAGGTTTFEVLDPATDDVVGTAPDCSPEELDQAVAASVAAGPTWAGDEDARRAALAAGARAIRQAVEELAPLLTSEQGKPLSDARMEVNWAADCLDYYAELVVPDRLVRDDDSGRVEISRRPVGTVAAITPWNFPISTASCKLAPALAAGNTVVLKPSPFTPLTTLRLGAVLAQVLPPGVLNVVSGGDEVGRRLVADGRVRKVTLTGSTSTGKEVAAVAGRDLKRLTLELGGNDAAIVLDDADPVRTAQRLFWRAFGNCGQVCAGIKRVYVPQSLHDEFVAAMAELATRARVGRGTEEGVQMGPVNNPPQFERVSGLVADALARGGVAAAGGHPLDGPGTFFAPTIVAGLTDGSRLVDEEQFGPALPIVAYRDLDDAVARANATSFGLGGSVWTEDEDRGAATARRLDCGTAWVNTHANLAVEVPFAGHKWSGLGVEQGVPGIEAFSDVQVLWTYRRKPRS
jgi:acyl-CoA reductase-like NAD-dependent aldehyde dehydrogenase